MAFLQWENQVTCPGESRLRQSRATQPTVHAGRFSVSIIHGTLTRDYGIFNMRTDVNARDCTRGCKDTVSESALKVDSGRKIPCRIGESNLCRRRAGPMLYQLSYIPNQFSAIAGGLHSFATVSGCMNTAVCRTEPFLHAVCKIPHRLLKWEIPSGLLLHHVLFHFLKNY